MSYEKEVSQQPQTTSSSPKRRRGQPGEKFNHWTILRDAPRRKSERYVAARCKCGKESEIRLENLISGKSRQCRSCAHTRLTPQGRILAKRFQAAKDRCTNSKNPSFPNYGGRGIEMRFASVSDWVTHCLAAWPNSDFREYDIDRADNYGHYEPGNLRLVSRLENLSNTRRNRYVDYFGTPVLACHLAHLLRTDFPDFITQPTTVARWSRTISVVEILGRDRARKILGLKSSTSWNADPEIVLLYRAG